MKQIINFIAICICMICCVSCSEEKKDKGIQDATPMTTQDILNHITKVEIEGHTYLLFRDEYGYRGMVGLCHDENCHCKTDSIK